MRLDIKPESWEDGLILFAGQLINERKKSTMVKSYISAIKAILNNDGKKLNEDQVLLASITCACRLKYDTNNQKLPIKRGVLGILLSKLDNFYLSPQPYLVVLYKAKLSMAYFVSGYHTDTPITIKAEAIP